MRSYPGDENLCTVSTVPDGIRQEREGERPSEHFLRPVVEGSLGGRVEVRDVAVRVADDDRVERRLGELPVAALGHAERVQRPLPRPVRPVERPGGPGDEGDEHRDVADDGEGDPDGAAVQPGAFPGDPEPAEHHRENDRRGQQAAGHHTAGTVARDHRHDTLVRSQQQDAAGDGPERQRAGHGHAGVRGRPVQRLELVGVADQRDVGAGCCPLSATG